MELAGIQSTICEGDNVEYDGVVFHIETLSFNCSISSDGKKAFHTALSLSNGMFPGTIDSPNDGTFPIYPGVSAKTLPVTNDPGTAGVK